MKESIDSVPCSASTGTTSILMAGRSGEQSTISYERPGSYRAARSTLDELVRLAAYWLKRAYELSGVTKPEGSMWHAFRRLWATARKAFPVKDVAAAGGWKDVNTLIDCYQQPDDDTCGPWWSS